MLLSKVLFAALEQQSPLRRVLALGVTLQIVVLACFGTEPPFAPQPSYDTASAAGAVIDRDTVGEFISAQHGGTITLLSGSSVTVPAGLLARDALVMLERVATLDAIPPNGAIMAAGPALALSLSSDVAPASGSIRFTLRFDPPRRSFGGATDLDDLHGAIAVAEIVDANDRHHLVGIPGQYDEATRTAWIDVPMLAAIPKRIAVGLVNTRASIERQPMPTAGQRTWTGLTWTDGLPAFDPNKRTLVLVHGMGGSVETAFGDTAVMRLIIAAGGYDQVVGFNYNWTNALEQSGERLAAFFEELRAAGVASIDAEAHGQGVPVLLAASSRTSLPFRSMVLLGGPIMGTPVTAAATAYRDGERLGFSPVQTLLVHHALAAARLPIAGVANDVELTLQDILSAPFVAELQPGSEALQRIRHAVIARMAQPGSNLSTTNIVAVTGSQYDSSPDMKRLGDALRVSGLFVDEAFDGIVGVASGRGDGAGFDAARFSTRTYPLSHAQLTRDSNVVRDVGADVIPYVLQVGVSGPGKGTVSVQPNLPNYVRGAVVTLTANADFANTFAGWSGDCGGAEACTLTMTANRIVTATFDSAAVTPYDGVYTGSFRGTLAASGPSGPIPIAVTGEVRFTVARGVITATVPFAGQGLLSSGSETTTTGTLVVRKCSVNFTLALAGSTTAVGSGSGSWVCTGVAQESGTWQAIRVAP